MLPDLLWRWRQWVQLNHKYTTFRKYLEIQDSYRNKSQEQNTLQEPSYINDHTINNSLEIVQTVKLHYTQNMFVIKLIYELNNYTHEFHKHSSLIIHKNIYM
jgi:hypothetical protein